MKIISMLLLANLVSISSAFASDWQNRLTCDEGLRIDEGFGVSFQIVLFGDAVQHFIRAGALNASELNAQGEYVQKLQANRSVFQANRQNGQLVTYTDFSRAVPSTAVWWRPIGDSGSLETDFKFYRCRN